MRLLLGLIFWVGMPFYWLQAVSNPPAFNLGVALVGTLFAIGMAFGEYSRAQRRKLR